MVSFFYMEILRTTTSEQTIKIIPRELITEVRFILKDKEQDSNIIDQNIICSIHNEFIIVPFTVNFFKEGRKYDIKILNLQDKKIWFGIGFCTDATDLQNFKLNG